MIEVEKKFQPTEEQLQELLKDSEFLGEVVNHDVYYDYPDYRLVKRDIRLRNRNGSFELKIGKGSGVAEEIEVESEIVKYFNTDSLEDFVKDNFVVFMDYSNSRKSYKKDGFTIALDDMSFNYKMCEIELLIEDESESEEATKNIMDFAKKYGFENQKAEKKRKVYLRTVKPEVYKELYGEE